MSKQTFTWLPDLGASRSVTPAVTQTKFGDGYELRTARGINTMPAKWSVSFSKSVQEAQQILDFIEARGGIESFYWLDPMNKSGTYVCREWVSAQSMPGVYVINCTFEQVWDYI